MYAHVAASGTITFRYDYRMNGRRETLVIGRYGRSGLSLSDAQEKCVGARRTVSERRSLAQEKQNVNWRLREAGSSGEFGKRWLANVRIAGQHPRHASCDF